MILQFYVIFGKVFPTPILFFKNSPYLILVIFIFSLKNNTQKVNSEVYKHSHSK